jgi:hypothetical protein
VVLFLQALHQNVVWIYHCSHICYMLHCLTALCSQTPSCVVTLMWEIKFYTHSELQVGSNSNASELYVEGTHSKSCLNTNYPDWSFQWFSSIIPDKRQDSTFINPWLFPSS